MQIKDLIFKAMQHVEPHTPYAVAKAIGLKNVSKIYQCLNHDKGLSKETMLRLVELAQRAPLEVAPPRRGKVESAATTALAAVMVAISAICVLAGDFDVF
jgi:hypothetical protein